MTFQGSDGTTLTPDDRTRYTIEFGGDGRLSARIDCNRGQGTWSSNGPSQVEFGPLALMADGGIYEFEPAPPHQALP